MNGKKMRVFGIEPFRNGFILRVKYGYENAMIYVDHRVEVRDGQIQVQYRRKPVQELITFYGRLEYRSNMTSYLTVVG
ncbi:MAG: hypothetical protein A2606_00885 [Candidatus Yanofskybacteria bacterium RIFOXYD1_FULL_42_10]|uniref:Uncharacterized protein n=1 Tax=Candidatus Yanofskybacteria bacterium RIFOXYD1_FULL_42_10 TaxID=1802718 RepID=A0A1F8HVR4_9BACT|nr:MAG: hypothetical protein A2606_00885 [Candidatus Yanofskybacteria bacterium RIFOXYD1_FULL_42_10]